MTPYSLEMPRDNLRIILCVFYMQTYISSSFMKYKEKIYLKFFWFLSIEKEKKIDRATVSV